MENRFPDSVWRADTDPTSLAVELDGDLDCDVAIVGGGYTGLRAAYELAKQGTDVVVLEARDIGWGASGRNGGQVNPMLPVALPEQLRAAVGNTYFERLAEVSLNSADDLFKFISEHHIDCHARQNGWIRANHCETARQQTYAAAREWNRLGAKFEFIEGEELHRLSGSKAFKSAVVTPKGGAIHALKLARGVAELAKKAGARLFRNASVSSATKTNNDWCLTANGYQVKAEQIIVATNGYSENLVQGLQNSLMALTPIQIACRNVSDNMIHDVLPAGQTISDTRRLIMYARREPDNTFLFGAIGFRKPGGIGGFGWLTKDLKRIFPQLSELDFEFQWGGQIAMTRDHIPHLHEPEPGMHVGFGYNGRGVAMSQQMGQILARRVLGEPAKALPIPTTDISRFPLAGFQARAAGIGMAWMRLRDQWEWS